MANNEKIKAAGKVPVDPDLRRHLDQPALRAGRLLQRAGRGAELRRRLHRQQGEVRDDPGGAEGLRAPEEVFKAGYLNEDFGAAKLRRRAAHGRDRRRRALPDADLRHRRHRAELSRQPQRRRLLRHARRRCRQERPDRLDAGGRSTSPRPPSIPRRPRSFLAFVAQHEGLRHPQRGRRRHRALPDQGLRRCRRRPAGRRRPAALLPEGEGTRPRRSSSCRRSRARRSSRSPSRSARASARPPTAPRSTTRTSRSRRSSSACPAGNAARLDGDSRARCRARSRRRSSLAMAAAAICARRRRAARANAASSAYPNWFYPAGAIIFAVLFLVPTRRLAVLQPDPLDAVRRRPSSASTISRSSSASRSCFRAWSTR